MSNTQNLRDLHVVILTFFFRMTHYASLLPLPSPTETLHVVAIYAGAAVGPPASNAPDAAFASSCCHILLVDVSHN